MYQVVPERFSELRRFFPNAPANEPMLQACLEGRAPGRAFVDRPREPTVSVVAMNYSFVFFSAKAPSGFIEPALRQLRRDQELHVVWAEEARLPRHPAPERSVPRLEFRQRLDATGACLRGALARLPAAGRLARIDRDLSTQCLWRDEAVRALGSLDAFLAHSLGYCLLLSGRVVAEAYACFWGLDRVEIAAITHPEHRGRGLGAVVCAQLIEACESIGFATYWNCDAGNEPSRRLAAKLGYVDPREYRLLRYERALPAA